MSEPTDTTPAPAPADGGMTEEQKAALFESEETTAREEAQAANPQPFNPNAANPPVTPPVTPEPAPATPPPAVPPVQTTPPVQPVVTPTTPPATPPVTPTTPPATPPVTPPITPPSPTVPPTPPTPKPLVDLTGIRQRIQDAVKTKVYKDSTRTEAEGQSVKGEDQLRDYSHVIDPVVDLTTGMIEEALKEIQTNLPTMIEERAKQIAAQQIQSTRNEDAEQQKAQAYVSDIQKRPDGIPDIVTILEHPNFEKFFTDNPQYKSLISTDPNRIGDLRFAVDRFREANGLTKPASSPAQVVAPARPDNRIIAGASSIHGAGHPGGEPAKLDSDAIWDAEEAKIKAERAGL